MKRRTLSLMAAVLTAAALLAGCAATDVVAQYAPKSLDAIVTAQPELVKAAGGVYTFSTDGQTSLAVNTDFSTGGDDVVFATPIAPFLSAGLDPAKLPEGYRADGAALVIATDFGSVKGAADSFSAALFQAVKADRAALGYHMELDHYGIQLRGGKFEWAKDYKTNDKDIVFVIAAKPLADLGVDVQAIDGWVFKTMDEPDGSKVDVLLMPYDLP